MTRPTIGVMFAGGGGVEVGAIAAGFAVAFSIEVNADICAVYALNFGTDHLHCADVRGFDYRRFAGTVWVHCSPPCQQFSVANANRPKAGDEDYIVLSCAWAVCDMLRYVRPQCFSLENVRGYADSDCLRLIEDALREYGYVFDSGVVNAANFSVPQTRERLILRAARRAAAAAVPALRPTHRDPRKLVNDSGSLFDKPLCPWVGWYAAVADLLPSCPESKLAAWQLARLPADFYESFIPHPNADNDWFLTAPEQSPVFTVTPSLNALRAVLVPGIPTNFSHEKIDVLGLGRPAPTLTASQPKRPMRAVLVEGASTGASTGERPPTTLTDDEPMFTVMSGEGGRIHRAILMDTKPNQRDLFEDRNYKVVALTLRCCARFQGFPDWWQFGEKRKTASTVIGNAVPPPLAEAIGRSFLEVLR